MAFAIRETDLCDNVGRILGNELRVRYGDRSSPVKRLARDLGVSEPTARGMFGGKLPATGTLLMAAKVLGSSAARRLFASFIGDMPEVHEFEELREIRARLDRVLPLIERRNDVARADQATGSLALALHQGEGADGGRRNGSPAGKGGSDRPEMGLALVEVRTTADIILSRAEGAGLQRHLGHNVVSLDAARALVQGDNLGRTGLAYRRQGEDWSVIPAPENRLWAPDPEPRPISRYQGNVVALRRNLEEASQSSDPIFVCHAGAVLIDGVPVPFHSAVVRIGREFRCGTRAVITDFSRLSA